jgi:hypothetical protein
VTAVASCHCGAVTVTADAPPNEVTDCDCSLCRRYGVLWAYYPTRAVAVCGPTDRYSRGARSIAFHRCAACGCVTHWAPVTREEDRMGVNARLFDPLLLAGVRTRRLDGAVTERYLDEPT